MVVSCPKCKAKYRVDPAKIGDKGSKIRCSKCKTLFIVRKPKQSSKAGATGAKEETRKPAAKTDHSKLFDEETRIADPKLIGPFLIPRDGALGSVDLEIQTVFAAGAHLGNGKRPVRAVVTFKKHGRIIFGVNLDILVVARLQLFARVRFDFDFRLFADRMDGNKICVDTHDLQPRLCLGEIDPTM